MMLNTDPGSKTTSRDFFDSNMRPDYPFPAVRAAPIQTEHYQKGRSPGPRDSLMGSGCRPVMCRAIPAIARYASAFPRSAHFGWTFKGPRPLRPLTRGATANPELWL